MRRIEDSGSIKGVISAIFQVLLIIFLLALFIQEFELAFIERYLWILVIGFGLLTVLLGLEGGLGVKTEKTKAAKLTSNHYVFIIIVGIVGGIAIWYKINDLGWIAYLLSVLIAALIIGLSLTMTEGGTEAQ